MEYDDIAIIEIKKLQSENDKLKKMIMECFELLEEWKNLYKSIRGD